MSLPIRFESVWKKFRLGERHDSLRDLVPSLVGRLVRRRDNADLADQEFWALRDVSFAVDRGEAFGIIGPNGAGKSTTLKLLTRILKPTRGHCEVHGRVGALIEVAAGFHPDLTGRENVFLQGAIMGMKQAEIARRMEEIVEFAGVGEFIDTQVKRYSSGMNARLGFSVAAHLDPDALIIDEVLSVGDMAFQQRCVERMLEFKRRGTAIVFVSHNLQAVQMLCDRALFVKSQPIAMGPVQDVLRRYVSASVDRVDRSELPAEVDIRDVELVDERGERVETIGPGERLSLRVTFVARERLQGFMLGFILHRSTDMLVVYSLNVHDYDLGIGALEPGRPLTVTFGFRANLTRNQYHIEVHARNTSNQKFVATLSPAAVFAVDEQRTFSGVADLQLTAELAEEYVS
jgi:lipopolysaccharide transport system ATP-binding protein